MLGEKQLKQAERICHLVEQGLSVQRACKEPGMPRFYTFYRWLQYEGPVADKIREMYNRARDIQVDKFHDELIDLADRDEHDFVVDQDTGEPIKDKLGRPIVNKESIKRTEMKIKTRQFLMQIQKPQVYGEKRQLEVTHNFNQMDDKELLAEAQKLMERLGGSLPPALIGAVERAKENLEKAEDAEVPETSDVAGK